jgi:glutathione S-transferase
MSLTLLVGNKNYSSWSMRPWVLMTQAGIAFTERMVRFDSFAPGSHFKQAVGLHNPVGKVPVLLDNTHLSPSGQPLAVWDTLAIAEYAAELAPALSPAGTPPLWPADAAARARARSVCAEMHSGFGALRSHFPMNIEASLPHIGALVLRDQPAVRADLDRLLAMWTQLLDEHGGPLLFGHFTVADAYFAPVVMRLNTYAVPVPDTVARYMQNVCELPGVQAWVAGALAEHDFLDFEEPYRLGR